MRWTKTVIGGAYKLETGHPSVGRSASRSNKTGKVAVLLN